MGKGFLCLALKNYFSRLPVLHHRDSRQLTLAGSSPITETNRSFCQNCETGKTIVSPLSIGPSFDNWLSVCLFIFYSLILPLIERKTEMDEIPKSGSELLKEGGNGS